MLYFYCTDETDDVQGPVSAGELKRLFSEGLLSPRARVCPEGRDEWSQIQEVLRTLVTVPAPPTARTTTATFSPPPLVSPPPLPSVAHSIPASDIPPLPFVTSGSSSNSGAGAGATVGAGANTRAPGATAPPPAIAIQPKPHPGIWLLSGFLGIVTTAAIVIPIVTYLDNEEKAHRMKFPGWMIKPMVAGTVGLCSSLTFLYSVGLQSTVAKGALSTFTAHAGSTGRSRSRKPARPVAIKVTVRQELYIIFGIIALAAFILLLVYLGQG